MMNRSSETISNGALFVALAALLVGCGDDSGSSACTPGKANCPCAEDGGACDEGLACEEGTCVGENTAGIGVSDARARACDVLLIEDGARIAEVTFGDAVMGTFVREAPRVAVSFIAREDAAIGGDAIRVGIRGAASAVRVDSVECADAEGATLSGATISLND